MFSEMLGDYPLPRITQFVIAVSGVLMHRLHVAVLAFGAAVVGCRVVRASKAGAYAVDCCLLGIPAFGNLPRLSASAQFCQTLGTLLKSGVSSSSACSSCPLGDTACSTPRRSASRNRGAGTGPRGQAPSREAPGRALCGAGCRGLHSARCGPVAHHRNQTGTDPHAERSHRRNGEHSIMASPRNTIPSPVMHGGFPDPAGRAARRATR